MCGNLIKICRRGNCNTGIVDSLLECGKSCIVCKKLFGIALSLTGETAATDLDGFNAEAGKICKGFIKGLGAKHCIKYAEFHKKPP